ncbi:hypothetical protein E4665_00240 [Sporolactobacillus shoreae]|uniref:Uncharacterized protein n=1 Tax=Sporolactobacillus shoreae TaxID=1465501 RepID=A0A4Z0GUY5_9BACL|nr:hypothetical protein [Sporolactobacillus shoreae]TGB00142.1 hypothetical protein E4665_00240 [Sporolactobacillus shoreae]
MSIIFTLKDQIFRYSPVQSSLEAVLFWTGYMIVLYALMSSGPALVLLREDQFLKMFIFISENKWMLVASKFISQLIILLLSSLILNILCSTLFFLPFLQLTLLSFFMILICDFPIYALFLFFSMLNIHKETVMPVTNIIIFIFIALTWNDFSSDPAVNQLITVINPIKYAASVGSLLLSPGSHGRVFSTIPVIAVATFSYLLIGFVSLKRMKILPIFRN